MAQILDELIIKLGLDSSGFKRDASSTQAAVAQTGNVARREGRALEEVLVKTQGETTKRMRQVEEVGRGAAQGFTRLKNEVVGLLGAIAGAYGIQQFIKNITTTDAATGYLAKTIGIATEDLSAWQEAAKRSGGSAEATGASMKNMSAEIQNFMLTHQSSMIPYLRQLQAMPGAVLTLTDAMGKATPVTEIYLALADRFSKMDIRRAIAIGGQLGIDEGTVRMLSKGREELTKIIDEQKRLGVVREQDAAAAIEFNNSIASLQQVVTRLGNAILTDFTPNIVAAVNGMTEWVVQNREWLKSDISDRIRTTIQVFVDIAKAIKEVVDFLGGWKNTTELIFGLWVASKVMPIVTMVGSLAAAMAGLATATAAVDTAAGGAGLKLLLGGGLLAGGAYGVNSALEKLEEMIYGKEFMDKDKAFRDSHSPIRDFVGRMFGGDGVSRGGATDERKAQVRDRLASDLGISGAAASGLVSNLNAESGISGINEVNPTVPGSRGGFGWAQWTGPRRTDFEAWAAGNGITDLASDAANIGFLKYELNTPKYANVLTQLRRGDITASEAANTVFSGYESGGDPKLEKNRAGHVAGAESIAKLPTTNRAVNRPDLTTGMPVGPQSAIDPGMRFALRSGAASSVDNSRSNTSSSETHIGAITVHTAATDAEGVAKGIGGALRRYQFVPESNYGLA